MFAHKFESLYDLFVHELKDLYDAEHQLLEQIPQIKDAVSSGTLRTLVEEMRLATERQKGLIEDIFRTLDVTAQRTTCPAMKGILNEAGEMLKAKGDPATGDAAVIASINRVQHYEIAGFGTLRAFAERLGYSEIAGTLGRCLDVGYFIDQAATALAEYDINAESAEPAAMS
mgnify:CR=1 FL=1